MTRIPVNQEFHPNVTVLDLGMTEGEEAKRQADELVGNSKSRCANDLAARAGYEAFARGNRRGELHRQDEPLH